MGTAVLRSHGGARSRFPAGQLRSSLPAKSSRSPNPARHVRTSPRGTNLSRNGEGCPGGGRSPPPQIKPFHNSNDSGVISGRSSRRIWIPEPESQMVVKAPAKNLVMEEVTILKRGEEVKPKRPAEDPQPSRRRRAVEDPQPSDREGTGVGEAGVDDLALCSTARLGPEPEILPKQMRLVKKPPVYAGSGFFMSPSPRSLPLPTSFFAEKEVASPTDLATKGLRYLLRLDLP